MLDGKFVQFELRLSKPEGRLLSTRYCNSCLSSCEILRLDIVLCMCPRHNDHDHSELHECLSPCFSLHFMLATNLSVPPSGHQLIGDQREGTKSDMRRNFLHTLLLGKILKSHVHTLWARISYHEVHCDSIETLLPPS